MRTRYYLFFSALLLASGGMIYIFFRKEELLLYVVADWAGLGGLIDYLRRSAPDIRPLSWVADNLPDGLWSASYVLLMHGMMRPLGIHAQLLWASVIPLLGVTSELMQGFGLLPGVFDTTDLLFYALPYALYYLFITTCKHHQHGPRTGKIS